MIIYLKRNQIDILKYNECVSNSFQSRVYAYSWYLDIVCDNWDVLVKDDYQAVMPLPKRKKYGIHYIYQAPWVQQLGVFSDVIVETSLVDRFIKSIPRKFKLIDVCLNSENSTDSSHAQLKDNYILPLNTNFNKIKDNYNKNRKRISKTDFSNFRIDKKGNISEFLSLYKMQEVNYKTHKDSFEKLQNLLNICNNHINIWNVYKNENLIAGLCWIKDHHRITYLVPITTDEAKKDNIPTYIVNELIKAHINTNYTLDFEGSMVEGVAKFYKSFGAGKETYFHLKKYII